MDRLKEFTERASHSPLIPSIDEAKQTRELKGRSLKDHEVKQLEKQQNRCQDWNQVRVHENFELNSIWNNQFLGSLYLGIFQDTHELGGIKFPSGISNSCLSDCMISDNCLVKDVTLMSQVIMMPSALMINCGRVQGGENLSAEALIISIGNELGGRDLECVAELDLALATKLVFEHEVTYQQEVAESFQSYREKTQCAYSIACSGSLLENCPSAQSFYLGECAQVRGAAQVAHSMVLSSAEEVTEIGAGVILRDSYVQWGTHLDSQAVVESSLMMEYSVAENQAQVHSSLIGPNTHLGKGEVTSSLVGPFVGMHHQSLLIGAIWPEGKGNVGYGANVGSNHSGKAPDQELFPGEGTFFGLGSSIKFPANYSEAPYSLISTGVVTLPQKVSLPFSLINAPTEPISGLSAQINEIMPGWMWSHNGYALMRNEFKFAKRNKARRNEFPTKLGRAELMTLVLKAKAFLTVETTKDIYLAQDIPALGKNFLRESWRVQALESYETFLNYYAFKALFSFLCSGSKEQTTTEVVQAMESSIEFKPFAAILHELNCPETIELCAHYYFELSRTRLEQVEGSRNRDHSRGTKIIADYGAVHHSNEVDELLMKAKQDQKELEARLAIWLK
ncbi:MAG: DUF4954 family protein [Planctomycetes bacterium]|nr:DUF4954 family protein [Planctomycetota bacterium]